MEYILSYICGFIDDKNTIQAMNNAAYDRLWIKRRYIHSQIITNRVKDCVTQLYARSKFIGTMKQSVLEIPKTDKQKQLFEEMIKKFGYIDCEDFTKCREPDKVVEQKFIHLDPIQLNGMNNLVQLDIAGNKLITDDDLTHMKNLRKLNLKACQSNITGACFKFMGDLYELDLSYNQFVKDDALKCLTNLRKLKLNYNYVVTGVAFQYMDRLEELHLRYNGGVNPDNVVKYCQNLKVLDLFGSVKTLHGCHLRQLKRPEKLNKLLIGGDDIQEHLDNIPYISISDISHFENLEYLNIEDITLGGFDELSKLTNLKTLICDGCDAQLYMGGGRSSIKDKHLQNLTNIEVLCARHCRITDNAIKNMSKLRVLKIYSYRITSKEISKHKNLTVLHGSCNKSWNSKDISGMVQLRRLQLTGGITDEYFDGLNNLEYIGVEDGVTNKILEGKNKLLYLDVGNDCNITGDGLKLVSKTLRRLRIGWTRSVNYYLYRLREDETGEIERGDANDMPCVPFTIDDIKCMEALKKIDDNNHMFKFPFQQ